MWFLGDVTAVSVLLFYTPEKMPSLGSCVSLGYKELSCLAGKQPKGTFLIEGYSVRMAPYLRKDSKRESCFELTSPDRRSYEVG